MIGKAVFSGGNAQSLDNVAGQPIAEYTHTKSGTVHKLEGPAKAKNIVFKATGNYNDGDTWTLNNKPVTVTYNGGEELLSTAVLIGDVVQAVVMGNQLRLILQKPTPQENLLINWDFTNPVNQRTKEEYEGNKIVTIDMWKTYNQTIGHKIKVMDGYVRLEKDPDVPFASMIQYTEFPSKFAGKTICFFVLYRAPNPFQIFVGTDENGTMNVVKKIGNLPAAPDWTLAGISFDVPETTKEQFTVFMQVNNKYGPSTYCDIKKVKIEQGNRFTGWPAWDYGAELEKCQRYLQILSGGASFRSSVYQPNYISFAIPCSVTFRKAPSIVNSNALVVRKTVGAMLEGFTFSIASVGSGYIRINAIKEGHGLTDAELTVKEPIILSSEI